ncbi:MAG: 2,3-bisphosphoglycerate-independent phosphoglycerate mutase [Candidatus Aenigmarchaeota archaeon]|nr:2,3-bisphosphoglycerate-independent phosphoglycerate mutase [Candidatus Aenigmarchaeota archaeon]
MADKNNMVALIILDGVGINPKSRGNAVALAKTPILDSIRKKYPTCRLDTCGEAVGLPRGTLGGSEVGHAHIGAGRVIKQELSLIDGKIEDGTFFRNKALLSAMGNCARNGEPLHLMGLLSDGGIHSHIRHLFALMDMAKRNKVKDVYIHALLDGRDTPPKSAKKYLRMVDRKIKELGLGRIATVMGRYYAMDRDNRWKREHKAYDAMVNGVALETENVYEAIEDAYSQGYTDEFVKPTIVIDKGEKHIVTENDSIIFFNFRSDRAREITRAFVDGEFKGFRRKKVINLNFVSLTQYDKKIKCPVAFPPEKIHDTLGEIISKRGLRQLRAAETEKYAHVTFFFNCGAEKPFLGEDRILVPSPKVATYDLKPEMSAYDVTRKAAGFIRKNKYSLAVINLANGDMVGHTGSLEAAVRAVEVIDECLGELLGTIESVGGTAIVFADHGNCEKMIDPVTGGPQTSHTMNKVFCTIVSDKKYKVRNGGLYNIAPTALEILGIKKPKVMAKPLIV